MSATLAAFAVLLGGLLPDAHLHASGDRTLVHRHAIDDGVRAHDDAAVGHEAGDNHADAHLLTDSYTAGSQLAGIASPVVVPWFLLDPCLARVKPISGKTLLPTHDPPFRFVSSPAPPALV